MPDLSHLVALAVQLAAAMGFPHAPRPLLEAAAEVVAADERPLEGSYDVELSIALYWVKRESSFRLDALGDGGLAHGPLQLHGACGLRSVREQVGCWLAIVHEGERRCTASPLAMTWGTCTPRIRAMADARVARAREILAGIEWP